MVRAKRAPLSAEEYAEVLAEAHALSPSSIPAEVRQEKDPKFRRIVYELMDKAAERKRQEEYTKRPILVSRDELEEVESEAEATSDEEDESGSDQEDLGVAIEAVDLQEDDDPRDTVYVTNFEEQAELNNANRDAEQRERAWEDAERKRKGKALAIATKEMDEDPNFVIDTETLEIELANLEEDANLEKQGLKRKPDIQRTPPGTKNGKITDFFTYFMSLEFSATTYPDKETMEALDILEDAEFVFRCCGIQKYMTMRFPTFKEAAAEFLATVSIQELHGDAMMDQFGGGMVTFDYNQKAQSTDLRKISNYFGFELGHTKLPNVSREELARVWKIMSSEDVLPNTPRGVVIRNPVMSYTRRAIAEAYFARRSTSSVSNQDLQFMAIIVSKMFEYQKNPIEGDIAHSGRAYVLCKFLESFRGKADAIVKKNQRMETFALGGIITGILKCAGLDPEKDGMKKIDEEAMDLNWMYKRGMLAGPRSPSEFYYKFLIPDGTPFVFKLPNKAHTGLTSMINTKFKVPEHLLADPKSLTPTKSSPPAPRPNEAGPKQKKRRLAATLTRDHKSAGTCPCSQPGFMDRLIADLTPRLMEQMSNEFVRKLKTPNPPLLDPIRTIPPMHKGEKDKPKRPPSEGTLRNQAPNRPPSKTPRTEERPPAKKPGTIIRLNSQRPPAHKRA